MKNMKLYWMLNTDMFRYLISPSFLWIPKKVWTDKGVLEYRWLIPTITLMRLVDTKLPINKNPVIAEGTEKGISTFWTQLKQKETIKPLSIVPNIH